MPSWLMDLAGAPLGEDLLGGLGEHLRERVSTLGEHLHEHPWVSTYSAA